MILIQSKQSKFQRIVTWTQNKRAVSHFYTGILKFILIILKTVIYYVVLKYARKYELKYERSILRSHRRYPTSGGLLSYFIFLSFHGANKLFYFTAILFFLFIFFALSFIPVFFQGIPLHFSVDTFYLFLEYGNPMFAPLLIYIESSIRSASEGLGMYCMCKNSNRWKR